MAWWKSCIVVAASVLSRSTLVLSSDTKDEESDMKIFMAEYDWNLSYKSSGKENLLRAEQLFRFGKASSAHIYGLLSSSKELSNKILVTNVNVRDESIGEDFKTTFRSSVVVMYAGAEPMQDLQGVLSRAVGRNQSERLVDGLYEGGIISTKVSRLLVSAFSNPTGNVGVGTVFTLTGVDENAGILRSSGETLNSSGKSPYVLVGFGLAFLLLLVSLVLFLVAGTCGFSLRSTKKKKESPYGAAKNEAYVRDTINDDQANRSGMLLGAKPFGEDDENTPPSDTVVDNLEANGAPTTGLSPRKSTFRRYDGETSGVSVLSPVSINTSMNISTTSRAPLGIMSIRKMPRFMTPQKEAIEQERPLYDLSKAFT